VTSYTLVTGASSISFEPTAGGWGPFVSSQSDTLLSVGDNVVTIDVVAPAGAALDTYTVHVLRAQLGDVALAGAVEIAPTFTPDYLGPYDVYAPAATSTLALHLACAPSCDTAS